MIRKIIIKYKTRKQNKKHSDLIINKIKENMNNYNIKQIEAIKEAIDELSRVHDALSIDSETHKKIQEFTLSPQSQMRLTYVLSRVLSRLREVI